MRKFKVVNGEGNTFELNGRNAFFHSIGGLGYSDSTQYEQIGTDFIPLEEGFSQGEITGLIFFGGREAYKKYREFARFVRATPLTLIYELDETYRVPVRLIKISKSELIKGGAGLNCEVGFLATGMYYKPVTAHSDILHVGGKIYPYEYAYSYSEVSLNTLIIESDSFAESPCRITIYGPAINPVWKHYVDNELVETGAFTGTIPADHKIVIDTTQIPYSIIEKGVSGETVADRYQMCDFTTERFFMLRHGTNRISVSHEGLNSLKMIVEGKISYETV